MNPEETLDPTEQLAVLTVHALNVLHDRYCCPECCPQCLVLSCLLTSGLLDETVNQAPSFVIRNPVWQTVGVLGKRVNRRWLYGRWDPELNQCPCTYGLDEVPEDLKPGRRARRLGPRTANTKACETHRQQRKKCTCRSEPVAA